MQKETGPGTVTSPPVYVTLTQAAHLVAGRTCVGASAMEFAREFCFLLSVHIMNFLYFALM